MTLGLVLIVSIGVAWLPSNRSLLAATPRALAVAADERISHEPGAGMVPLVPTRLLDTRAALGGTQGLVGADSTIEVQITGHAGIPSSGVGAVVLNVTAVGATAPSYVTAWPTDVDRPVASNLNVAAGHTIPNLVIVKLGTDGHINLYNKAGTLDLLADSVG